MKHDINYVWPELLWKIAQVSNRLSSFIIQFFEGGNTMWYVTTEILFNQVARNFKLT